MMGTAPKLEGLALIGQGIARPEDVVVARDGTVWASDKASACARIAPDGTLSRVGKAGGEPNGIKIDPRDGSIVIANIGSGSLQRLDPVTGAVTTILTEAGGAPILTPNYLLFDSRGNLWCSVSARRGRSPGWLDGTPDGFVFRVSPSGEATVVAENVRFANGLALDANEEFLYVAQTSADNVLRYRIRGATLAASELHGPASLGAKSCPDGLAFDAAGNLWVTLALANRIVAIAPDGGVSVLADDATDKRINKPSNIAFGGADLRDVYIGSIGADYVLRGRASVPGLPLAHQR